MLAKGRPKNKHERLGVTGARALAGALLGCAVAVTLLSAMGCRTGASRSTAVPECPEDRAKVDNPSRIAPMLVRSYGVFLEVSFDGCDPVLMRYDTGSPTTVVDAGHASHIGIVGGQHQARIGAVEIGRRTITLVDWIEAEMTYPGLPGPIKGVVGNDFFAGFAVGLHYPAQEIWLMAAGEPISRPRRTERKGRSTTFDDSSGYLVVPCRLTTRSDEQVCLFDTGAINSLAYTDYWESVAPPNTPGVPMITFDNQGNTIVGSYRRSDTVITGSMTLPGDVVVVVDEFALLSSVAAAIGEPVVGLIGVSGTFPYYTVIDYPNRAITAFPYLDREPLFPSPFVGHGFIIASDGAGGLEVRAVVPASSAAAAGLMAGDRLVAVDGRPLAGAGLDFTIASLIADPPGTRRVFELDRRGSVLQFEIHAEDLLPRRELPAD